MLDNSRRQFLSKYFLHHAGRCLQEFEEGLEEARQKAEFDKFFESYESSYALTLAYPDDILLETAKKYDIETENRSKNDIVKELFIKKGGF
ncbi:hypothetical protein ACFL2E_09935 [Thermodesulfobacteriota bacterium]